MPSHASSTQHRPALDKAAQLLADGIQPLLDAVRAVGLHPIPSLRTMLRGAASGELEAIKFAGRWLTSAQAVVRWVARMQFDAPPIANAPAMAAVGGASRPKAGGA